jgi:hypothetical protein
MGAGVVLSGKCRNSNYGRPARDCHGQDGQAIRVGTRKTRKAFSLEILSSLPRQAGKGCRIGFPAVCQEGRNVVKHAG